MTRAAFAQPSQEIEVPSWVPTEFLAVYRVVAKAKGEEQAAAVARRLKAAGHEQRWTPPRVTLLVTFWVEGKTSSATAAALGDGITRNAVIGKRARLGLMSDRPVSAPQVLTPTRPIRVVAKAPPPQRRLPEPVAPVVILEPVGPAIPGGIELLDLEYHHCRWPIADGPPMRFCGARKADGAPAFCKAHALRAYDGRTRVLKSVLKATGR